MAFGSLLILTASAFAADRPTEDIWSLRTMGIWSEPYENDLRVLTNGDELELGFDDSFGFSAAIGWQPKGFAFGFELEYRSTEHELVSGKLPELGAITADATRTVETIFLNAVARQQLGLDITIFGGVGLGYSSIDFDLRSFGRRHRLRRRAFLGRHDCAQGFAGFEKAMTDDLSFVTQLGWFQADEPRLENELDPAVHHGREIAQPFGRLALRVLKLQRHVPNVNVEGLNYFSRFLDTPVEPSLYEYLFGQ